MSSTRPIPEWAQRSANTLRRTFAEVRYSLEQEFNKGMNEVHDNEEDLHARLRRMHELVYRYEHDSARAKQQIIIAYFGE